MNANTIAFLLVPALGALTFSICWVLGRVAQHYAVNTKLQILVTGSKLATDFIQGWWAEYKPAAEKITASGTLSPEAKKALVEEAVSSAKAQLTHVAPALVDQASNALRSYVSARVAVLAAPTTPEAATPIPLTPADSSKS